MVSKCCKLILLAGVVGTPLLGEKSDGDLLQGAWRVVSVEVAGKKAGADELKELQKDPMVFRGDKLIGRYDAIFKLDSTKTPKEIDVTPITAGKDKLTFHGIYRLDGDELTLCLSSVPNGSRPGSFTLQAADKAGIIVLRRMK